MSPLIKHSFNILRNKYVLVTIFFIIWVSFFDKNNLFYIHHLNEKLNTLKTEREYYIRQTAIAREEIKELQTNPENLEKYAREKYLMKKDNEDVYVIVDSNNRFLDTIHLAMK